MTQGSPHVRINVPNQLPRWPVFRGFPMAAFKCSPRAQECSTILGLIGDRLQLSTECLLALTQHRHALTQLFDRQESFLVGVEKSFDTLANMG
jgi:hypothetical protein